MHLSPRDIDKLAPPRRRLPRAEAPRARPAPQLPRGRRAARDAAPRADPRRPHRVAELMDVGRRILGRRQVLAGVPEIDRTRCRSRARSRTARSSSPCTIRSRSRTAISRSRSTAASCRCPIARALRGAARRRRRSLAGRGRRRAGRRSSSTRAATRVTLAVTSRGDRPIQVGSHYPFAETNRALDFDRARGRGHAPRHPRRHRRALRARRDAQRHARREREQLVPATRRPRDRTQFDRASGLLPDSTRRPMSRIDRRAYADDVRPDHRRSRARSATPGSSSEVERDLTSYGDECKFGGGKVLRDQHGPDGRRRRRRRARRRHHQRAHRRLDRHLQGRRRHQGRPHRRHRQGRQPAGDGRRRPGDGRRRHHRGHRRRGPDPHRGRHRLAHPFHLPAAGATRRSRAASPRSSAAAPAPRPAPTPRRARPARGTSS